MFLGSVSEAMEAALKLAASTTVELGDTARRQGYRFGKPSYHGKHAGPAWPQGTGRTARPFRRPFMIDVTIIRCGLMTTACRNEGESEGGFRPAHGQPAGDARSAP